MLKKMWLYSMRTYLELGLFFYFRRIHMIHLNNIPKDKPVLILPNHQNALLDALIIAVKGNRISYFLTRASAFHSPLIAKILKSYRMLPVYRIRDGIRTIKKNNEVFEACSELLNQNHSLVIFPEGNHNLKRTVRPLSKGFTRIVFDTLEKHPDLDLQLVPVGFNYKKPECFVDEVSLYIGNPIKAQEYGGYVRNEAVVKLKADLHQSISKLTTHIPHDHYDDILKKLIAQEADFLNPKLVNESILNNFKNGGVEKRPQNSILRQLFKGLLIINLWLPYLLWKKWIEPKIKEVEFVSTFRFTVVITLVPFYLLLVTLLLTGVFGWFIALAYLLIVIILALIVVKY